MKTLIVGASPLALLLASASALAAPAPPPAPTAPPPGISDLVQEAAPPVRPLPQNPLPKIEGIPTEAPMAALPGGQATLVVKAFRLTGNKEISTATLEALVKDALGKPVTLDELHAVATRITRYYRDRGFFVARAYVPAQDVLDQTVVIHIIEGHYGEFHIDSRARLRKDIAQGILDAVKSHDIVSVDTLERAMLILNDTPGVKVTQVSVSPGARVGTSDFNVKAEATPLISGVATLDNYGGLYTGKERASLSASIDGPTRSGDRLDLYGLVTNDDELDSGRIAYTRLLTATGLQGEIGVSRTQYSLGDTYKALDATGTADSVEAQLSYPLKLTETERLQAQLNFVHSDLQDDVKSTGTKTPKTTDAIAAGLEFSQNAPLWANSAGATFTFGHLGIGDAIARAGDADGAKSQGDFAKLNLHVDRRQALWSGLVLNLDLHGQLVLDNKSLDGSQKLTVSGYTGVQAYSPDELLADNGVVGRATVSRPFTVLNSVTLTPRVFVDAGWAKNRFTPTDTPADRSMSDVGVGVVAAYRKYSFTVDYIARTSGGRATSEPTGAGLFMAQLAVAF